MGAAQVWNGLRVGAKAGGALAVSYILLRNPIKTIHFLWTISECSTIASQAHLPSCCSKACPLAIHPQTCRRRFDSDVVALLSRPGSCVLSSDMALVCSGRLEADAPGRPPGSLQLTWHGPLVRPVTAACRVCDTRTSKGRFRLSSELRIKERKRSSTRVW